MTIDSTPPSRGELELEAAADKVYNERWWETRDNVTITAHWMADHGWQPSDFVLLIEKPWKFSDEFVQAQAWVEDEGGIGAVIEIEEEDGTPFDEDPLPPTFNEMLEAERAEAFATIDPEVSQFVRFVTEGGGHLVIDTEKYMDEDAARGDR